jgi:hypothetical protein
MNLILISNSWFPFVFKDFSEATLLVGLPAFATLFTQIYLINPFLDRPKYPLPLFIEILKIVQ